MTDAVQLDYWKIKAWERKGWARCGLLWRCDGCDDPECEGGRLVELACWSLN